MSLFPGRSTAGVLAAVTCVCIVLGAAWLISRSPQALVQNLPPGGMGPLQSDGQTVAYAVMPGRSASEIGRDLEALGVLKSALQFSVLVSLMGLEQSLDAGKYELPTGASAATIVKLLAVPESAPVIRVTFPEGIRIEEMATLAEEAGFGSAQDFIEAAQRAVLPSDFANDLPQGADHQGYLFPDTYIMPEGSTAADLVELMMENLDQRFDASLREAVRKRGLTIHEALTLASVVEREAAVADERPLIAGVFFNRLAAGDRLGADPTVQFAVALNPANVLENGYWKKELTFADLELESPYNTRKFAGLPPGPITNPGLASIEAVARPVQTKMYYFVANAVAGDGTHVFAETLEEHRANTSRYGE